MIEEIKQAVGFLTRLPLGKGIRQQSGMSKVAVKWYGFVGLIIGALLSLSAAILDVWFSIPHTVLAAIVLALWIGITGALHLDGLADCGDAVMGGFDKDRMLIILKDQQIGVGAMVAVITVLLLKWTSLSWLFSQDAFMAPLFAATLSRIMLTLTIMEKPYVREQGLGTGLKDHLVRKNILLGAVLLSLILLLISLLGYVYSVIGCLLGATLVWFFIARKIGGYTGDVYGAQVEVTEVGILIFLVAFLSF
ncbi:MAG: adenosylcobinamide-GDP ribazoletransferase [Gammaproteobacteria bacterium]|nr:adenosylcobinamide-GDP ribazoletransferase [Gammaproteobacteria bacterium]MCY4219434.1 adenosylcobinamide-GDP ribazoletransferase [Gammaproteobacteria bacterium]MCY4275184.1 adenosylcobinamide-GDP ribazoletransferase [Gammaproteobacteria bacterium]